ncbi:MAG: hypothetical protein GYB65_02465 [Chloroflexi bacterium]|nr:hypothetical protein [Chloroflexota bacterium]
MAITLRQVLQAFEQADETIRLDQLCQKLDVDPGTLDGMLQYWVRKGRIREVQDAALDCQACGVKGKCPFVIRMPRRYELVREGDQPPVVCCSPQQ